jgi:hypothetical protein
MKGQLVAHSSTIDHFEYHILELDTVVAFNLSLSLIISDYVRHHHSCVSSRGMQSFASWAHAAGPGENNKSGIQSSGVCRAKQKPYLRVVSPQALYYLSMCQTRPSKRAYVYSSRVHLPAAW